MTQLRTGALSDTGKIRKRNEDAHLVQLSQDIKKLAVADGMGGHQGGHIASRLALEVIDNFSINGDSLKEDMGKAVYKANEEIIARASGDPELEGMGTTITFLGINEKKALVAHVGDSRLYLFRKGRLQRITRDQSLVEEMVRQGKLSPEEAAIHPQRNVLLQALGVEEDIEVDFYELKVQQGDLFLLCTDGLTGPVSDEEITQIIKKTANLQKSAEEMVELANARGGHDNITVVLCAYDGE